MWNRLARYPSTASLTPAARKSTKAIQMYCSPDAIAQTTIGTSRMRPSVMRFGILTAIPTRGSVPVANAGNTPIPLVEYNDAVTIARLAIPTYDPGASEVHHDRKTARSHLRAGRC